MITKLDETLRFPALISHARGNWCHYPGCEYSQESIHRYPYDTIDDILEEDHIPELVNYAKLRNAQMFFLTGFPHPYKFLVSWTVCSLHHSMITQDRIRGADIPYTPEIQTVVESVRSEGKRLSAPG